MDWTSTNRIDRFTFELVDPNDLSGCRGWLTGVTKASLTFGYYTDTRVSGTLTAYDIDDEWIENSLIRIHHFVDSENYENELATCFVEDISRVYEHGVYRYDFTLRSTLWRLEDDILTSNLTLAKNSYSKDALKKIFNKCGATYSIASSCANYKYKKAVVYEAGSTLLSDAFGVCDQMNSRLDVNGHGTLTVKPYTAPSKLSAIDDIDDSMIVGSITKTDGFYSVANRALVIYSNGSKTITGYADMASTNQMAYGRRGKRVVDVYNLSDMSPANSTQATKLAKSYLANNVSTTTYSMQTLYYPLNTGEVLNIRFDDTDHKLMLQTRDLTVGTGMACKDVWRAV